MPSHCPECGGSVNKPQPIHWDADCRDDFHNPKPPAQHQPGSQEDDHVCLGYYCGCLRSAPTQEQPTAAPSPEQRLRVASAIRHELACQDQEARNRCEPEGNYDIEDVALAALEALHPFTDPEGQDRG